MSTNDTQRTGGTRMKSSLLITGAQFTSSCAIALTPVSFKIPFGGVEVTPGDLLIAATALLLIPAALGNLRDGTFFAPLYSVLPFLLACTASLFVASDKTEAAKELIQLILYAGVGTWVFSFLASNCSHRKPFHRALYFASIIAAAGCIASRFAPAPLFQQAFSTISSLTCSLIILLSLLFIAFTRRQGRHQRTKRLAALYAAGISLLFLSTTMPHAQAQAGRSPDPPPLIPQRYLEAHAAMTVLAEKPLLGIGLGNYQQHIGEYYQGMPKDNTIRLGTRMGYTVLLASSGFLGLAAYIYWLISLSRRPLEAPASGILRTLSFAPFFLVGLFTPLLVGQILLPLILLDALTAQGGRPS